MRGGWSGLGGVTLRRRQSRQRVHLARGGATLRGGVNLPNDFGFSPIRPAGAGGSRKSQPSRWGFHLFTTLEGRLVAHNIFVDGSLFQDSRSVDKEPWVTDLVMGATATMFRDLNATYAYVIRSEEFKGQDNAQEFGSVSVGWSF